MSTARFDTPPRRSTPDGDDLATTCSRRRLFGTAAGAGGAALASRLLSVAPAAAHDEGCHHCHADPIPNGVQPFGPGTQVFHVFPPDPSAPQLLEPATITNFSGFLGLADVRGTGTETNRHTGATRTLSWEVDLRFFDGFIASHDARRLARCTFGFV
jgi:hypothetical protein